jgi:hypothetical protein
MEPTEVLISGLRSRIRFHPFNRLKFWLTSAFIALSVGAVVWTINFLVAHRKQLISFHL